MSKGDRQNKVLAILSEIWKAKLILVYNHFIKRTQLFRIYSYDVDVTETCINEAACWYEVSPSVERGTRNILFFCSVYVSFIFQYL